MNTQLIESLIQVINSLSKEERNLLEEKLQHQANWEKIRARILKRGKVINERLTSLSYGQRTVSVSEIIHQMREERDEQLMQTYLPRRE
jgi:hypothetical protein